MNNTSEVNEEGVNASDGQAAAKAQPLTPGSILRQRREELGYSREQVSESLYITVHYVTALENDQYDKLPGLTFVKGYFKSYAGFLGMDVDEVVASYEEYTGDRAGVTEKVQAIPNLAAKAKRKRLIVSLVAVVVIAALGWWVADMALAGTYGSDNIELGADPLR